MKNYKTLDFKHITTKEDTERELKREQQRTRKERAEKQFFIVIIMLALTALYFYMAVPSFITNFKAIDSLQVTNTSTRHLIALIMSYTTVTMFIILVLTNHIQRLKSFIKAI